MPTDRMRRGRRGEAKSAEPHEILHQWLAAVQHRDVEYLERLLAEDFTLTTGRAGAEVRSREEYLSIAASRYEIADYRVEDVSVRRFGDVAVVQCRYWQSATFDGSDRSGAFRLTDVLVHTSHGWLAAVRHSSAVSR